MLVCHTGSPRWFATQAATYSTALSISPLPPQLSLGLVLLLRPPSSLPLLPFCAPLALFSTRLRSQSSIVHRSCSPALPAPTCLFSLLLEPLPPRLCIAPLLCIAPPCLHSVELLHLATAASSQILAASTHSIASHPTQQPRLRSAPSSNIFCRFCALSPYTMLSETRALWLSFARFSSCRSFSSCRMRRSAALCSR